MNLGSLVVLFLVMLLRSQALRPNFTRSPSSFLSRFRMFSSKIPEKYPELLQQLYQINMYHPVKLGLQNMQSIYEKLGSPLEGIPIIHITGTNGKGSVALKLAKSLRASGLRTGLFVSPHIASFRERVQINDELLTEKDVEEYLPRLFTLCQTHSIPATFFELTTALAFLKFRDAACDAIVLEVGLGGRLDATNVITPVLSIITSIQLDHTKILGDTVEAIAREKAGIIKHQVPFLVGPECPMHVFQERAEQMQAPMFRVTDLLTPADMRCTVQPADPASNEQQATRVNYIDTDDLNRDLSLAALSYLTHQQTPARWQNRLLPVSDPVVQDALLERPPCRFEQFQLRRFARMTSTGVVNDASGESVASHGAPVRIILDIAHNIRAMEALVVRVHRFFPRRSIRVVLGMSADKDVSACMSSVLSLVRGDLSRVYCTAAKHPRALDHQQLRTLLEQTQKNSATAAEEVKSSSNISSYAHQDGEIRNVLLRAIMDAQTSASSPTTSSSATKKHAAEDADYAVSVTPLSSSSHWTAPAVVQDKAEDEELVVVCGTAFIMAEVRAVLGMQEPRDGVVLISTSNNSNNTASLINNLSNSSNNNHGKGSSADTNILRDAQEYFAGATSDSNNTAK